MKHTYSNTWTRTRAVLYCAALKHRSRSCTGTMVTDDRPYPFRRMTSIRGCVSYRSLVDRILTAHVIPQWNGITSLRFCGPYILCFRARSVEAYPVPTDTPTADPLPMLRHRFGAVCFRDVSLSHVRVSHCASGDVYTLFMLTNDVYQGMFHYRIRVTTTPVPSMSVHVLAKGSIPASGPLPLVPGSNDRHTFEEMVRLMFLSTWSLGSAGLRGVWVDRQRGSIDRRVVAFTTHPSRLRTKEAALVPGEDSVSGGDEPDEPPTMDGKVIHNIASYNLRGACVVRGWLYSRRLGLFLFKDDITICAVSEWTGHIALGSRVGVILLL
jgi:hypothetical protein